jgi:hypothetical protein
MDLIGDAMQSQESDASTNVAINARLIEEARRYAEIPAIRIKGEAALRRLLPIAQRDCGQSYVVARLLLSLYNSDRFPFALTDLRRLDWDLFDDCIAVLTMDSLPQKEVHLYFENGGTVWEDLAKEWGFTDHFDRPWR